MALKLLFPILFITGVYFLIKSIGRIMQVYGGPKTEFSANAIENVIKFSEAGDYEIAYKRPSINGVIPTNWSFELIRESDKKELLVWGIVNPLGMRKDMSGNRVVPIATFFIDHPGSYTLHTTESVGYKDGDKLLVTAQSGSKGFIAIFAILLSAIATIAGLVLSILAFMNKI
ncbi:hypothetical protein [Dyadobacter sp. CY326]|uniref:hypothetical protein n=1 Tax=Dyadobacter sp. CY326 TaxID=2907300 RepID=UPI001F249B63|nr:hypothetical protein [Dyadobacter sp. CY326]MCE7065966.1 hypothetical protein [Dyadobacter sp. CY326]